MSWQQSTLGELIELENGYAFKSDEYTENGHFLMRISNVQQGYISMQAPKFVSIPPHSNLVQFELNQGDMLMSLTGNVGRVGLIETHHLPAALNQRVAKIKIKDLSKIDKGYLFCFFSTDDTRAKIENLGHGAAQLNVSTKDVKSLTIPLPSLAQQKRIAAILDKAAEIKAKREQAIAKLDELAQSTFVEMFGDAALNKENWQMLRLDELVEDGDTINYGVVQPGDDVDVGVPLLRVGDLVNGNFSLSILKKIAPTIESQYKRSRIKGNEILISCVGTIGTVVPATAEMIGFNIARAVARVPVSKRVNKVYLENYLRSKFVQRYFLAELRTVSQPTLNIKQICETKVMLPPLHMQKEYELRVGKITSSLASTRDFQIKLDRLTASLQFEAFITGFAS